LRAGREWRVSTWQNHPYDSAMKIEPIVSAGRPLIIAYGAGGFRFGLASGDLRIEGAALVLADTPKAMDAKTNADLTEQKLEPILALSGQIEFLLLGTGPKMVPPPPFLRAALAQASIGLELMDSAAACRAYNHLASEGRHFAALLLPVDTASA
jgi:uncharacterized protein